MTNKWTYEDLSGKRFNRLLVKGRKPPRNGYKLQWICICDCGKQVTVDTYKLKSGHTKSCGCWGHKFAKIKHGLSKTPEYDAWTNMLGRCYSDAYPHPQNYRHRGIKVCQRWRNSFETFLEDMGNRPSPKYSLERINNDGDYKPSNCKWATWSEQMNNRRPFSKRLGRGL